MKFDFEVNYDDFNSFVFENFINKNGKRIVTQFRIFLVIVLILSSGVISLILKDFEFLYVTLFVCTFLPFIIPKDAIKRLYYAKIGKILSKKYSKNYPCKYSIEMNTNKLIIKNEKSKSEIQWDGIKDVIITPDYFYLYIGVDEAIIIPKKNISPINPDEIENELQNIEMKLNAEKKINED